MSAPKRRTATAPKLALRIARAQLRALRPAMRTLTNLAEIASHPIISVGPTGSVAVAGQFIQCWAVARGYSGITQALDSTGQVWERVSLMGESQEGGVKRKFLKDSWWEPLSMERRALTTTTEAS